ncbi:efflux RND transporter periplasmic adaptor subunit [Bacteroidales bacterium OttesenSCG-928-L03]|nr:efflux RND transporter periplasmic adaptor subunit [Bacteroidales bacterium OttesenSCG-928-L03]
MNKYIGTLLFLPLLFLACSNNKSSQEISEVSLKGDILVVQENSAIRKSLMLQKAELHDYTGEFRAVGTVRPASGKFVEIAPPFAGRITRSFVKLGQKVHAGSPMFELNSPEFFEATKAYFAARSANELAQKNYKRQQDLAANGVASQRDLEEAESEALLAGQEYKQAQATMNIFNIDISSLQMGQAMRMLSPISGEVVKCDLTVGSYLKEDAEPVVAVADLSRVWVKALVKEKYFGAISAGDKVEVYTDAHPNKIVWGTIYYIGEILDEETRSLEIIVECDNKDRELKLGMFCEAHFLSTPGRSIILPATAIMQEQEYDYVFVELSPGEYTRRKVETETVSMEEVRIVSGLEEGESVVVKGGIYLNR